MGHQMEGMPESVGEGEDAERLILPVSLVAVFGLERVMGGGMAMGGPTDAYVDRVYRINMPRLLTEESEALALDPRDRARIDERAKDLVAIPRAQRRPFTNDELKAFEGYLDGMAEGRTIAEIADDMHIPNRTLKRRVALMRDYLGAPNEASIVYGSLLHGYVPKVSLPDAWAMSPLTPNEDLHLYLAALGFQKPEAADIVGVKPVTVHQHRMRGLGKFGAKSTTQALARAFISNHFVSLVAHQ